MPQLTDAMLRALRTLKDAGGFIGEAKARTIHWRTADALIARKLAYWDRRLGIGWMFVMSYAGYKGLEEARDGRDNVSEV